MGDTLNQRPTVVQPPQRPAGIASWEGIVLWLFSVPEGERRFEDIAGWWARRRLAYNLIVGSVAIPSFVIFLVSIVSCGILKPGEDAEEPMALLLAPIAVNVCYTAGQIVERFLWTRCPARRQVMGPLLFKLGLGFSLFVVTFPALTWGGYRACQLFGLVR